MDECISNVMINLTNLGEREQGGDEGGRLEGMR